MSKSKDELVVEAIESFVDSVAALAKVVVSETFDKDEKKKDKEDKEEKD